MTSDYSYLKMEVCMLSLKSSVSYVLLALLLNVLSILSRTIVLKTHN